MVFLTLKTDVFVQDSLKIIFPEVLYTILKQVDPDDPSMLDVKDHLDKVFPDHQLRLYFIEYCANLLIGGNNTKTFIVMSGEGDNGKSVNTELLRRVLGEYMIVLPTSLVTGKRTQSSAATPELSNSKGIRFAVLTGTRR